MDKEEKYIFVVHAILYSGPALDCENYEYFCKLDSAEKYRDTIENKYDYVGIEKVKLNN